MATRTPPRPLLATHKYVRPDALVQTNDLQNGIQQLSHSELPSEHFHLVTGDIFGHHAQVLELC